MDVHEARNIAKRLRIGQEYDAESTPDFSFGRALSFSAAADPPPETASSSAVPPNVLSIKTQNEKQFTSPLSVLIPDLGTPKAMGAGSPTTPHTPWDMVVNSVVKGCPPTPIRGSSSGKYKVKHQSRTVSFENQEESRFNQTRLDRATSLEQTKVLVSTTLKRTQSIVQPSLFAFDEHFDFTRVVGRSQYSEVYEARSRSDGTITAVKRSVRPLMSYADRTRHMHEVEVFQGLGEHPNIVKYYRCWQQDGFFYVQLELCTGGSLSEVLDVHVNRMMPELLVWRIVREVGSGLQYIHDRRVLHLDIKPDNIFLDLHGTFKIGDFGLAVVEDRWDWEDGDGKYVAPELLRDETQPTAAADIYSFGVMLYECLCGECLPRSPARAGRVEFPPGCPPKLCELITRMLANDPKARPSAADILQADADLHPEEAHLQHVLNEACTPRGARDSPEPEEMFVEEM